MEHLFVIYPKFLCIRVLYSRVSRYLLHHVNLTFAKRGKATSQSLSDLASLYYPTAATARKNRYLLIGWYRPTIGITDKDTLLV